MRVLIILTTLLAAHVAAAGTISFDTFRARNVKPSVGAPAPAPVPARRDFSDLAAESGTPAPAPSGFAHPRTPSPLPQPVKPKPLPDITYQPVTLEAFMAKKLAR